MADGEDARRVGQEGSRWYNEIPSGKELGDWFKANVDLHEGLEAEHYVQGVTLIPGVEKAKAVVGWQGKNPVIEQTENLVYTPYAKVETRVKYFHDLMALKPEWLGMIEPVKTEKQSAALPPGFFPFVVATDADSVVRYICCTMKVTVWERDGFDEKRVLVDSRKGLYETRRTGKKLIDAPPATKMIGTLGRYGADDFSLMKAETGAVGRALGMAGMLVIPGTGIATAEDLQEAQAIEGRPQNRTPAGEGAETPDAQPEQTVEDLRQQAILVVSTLKSEFPERFESAFKTWAASRNIGEVAKITDPLILRGLATKAENELTDARSEAPPPPEADPVKS